MQVLFFSYVPPSIFVFFELFYCKDFMPFGDMFNERCQVVDAENDSIVSREFI